jgi:hypothetical protein
MSYKVTRFSEEDFEEGTTVERIYMSMMQPDDFVLTDRDFKYAEVLDKAWGIIWTMRPYSEKLIHISQINGGLWHQNRIQIYNDAQELYSRFDEVKPKILRGVMVEKLRLIAEDMEALSKNTKDEVERVKAAEVARRSYETIAKLTNLHKPDDVLKKSVPPPSLPKFTTHPIYENATIVEDV